MGRISTIPDSVTCCYGCKERHTCCWSHCEKYQKEKQQNAVAKAALKADKDLHCAIYEVHVKNRRNFYYSS